MNLLNIPKNIVIDLNINNYTFESSICDEWQCIEIFKNGIYFNETFHPIGTPLNDVTKLKSLKITYSEISKRYKKN